MPKKTKISDKVLKSLAKARKVSLTSRKQEAERRAGERRRKIVKLLLGNLKSNSSDYCCHLTVGSSQFHALINGKLSPLDTHCNKNSLGSFSNGSSWENYVQKQSFFRTVQRKTYTFEVLSKDPFFKSKICPVLVATPDFLIKYLDQEGQKKMGLIEVKSHNRKENRKSFITGNNPSQALQLQVALQASGIDIGFLFLTLANSYSSQSASFICTKVQEFRKDPRFIRKFGPRILAGYSKYIARLSAFPNDPDETLFEFAEQEVQKNREFIIKAQKCLPSEDKGGWNKPCFVPKGLCRISNLIRAKINKQNNRPVTRGRPRIPSRLLKRSLAGKVQLREIGRAHV